MSLIRTFALTGLIVASIAAASPSVAADPETRSFRDWRVVCDNGGDCVAYVGGTGGPTAFVRVSMPAGPDAEPDVMIGAWGQDPDTPLDLVIDGAPRRLAAGPESEWAGVAQARGAEARELLAAMAAGDDMKLSVAGETAAVSVAGVSAALLWIDERQGRLNTVTALIRRGNRPASMVPGSPELPRIRAMPASISQFTQGDHPAVPAEILAHPSVADCREDWGEPVSGDGILYAEVGPSMRVWGVQCYMAAYNAGHVLFVTDHRGRNVRALVLSGVDEEVEVFTNVDIGWSITNNVRGRGLGDCGVIQTWTYASRGFELASEHRMDECWGMPPELWPALWRTR